MSATKVQKLIKDSNAQFVDLRFTDTIGKEQHVTVPSHTIDSIFFKEGKMFDGSSIAGWSWASRTALCAWTGGMLTKPRTFGLVSPRPPAAIDEARSRRHP